MYKIKIKEAKIKEEKEKKSTSRFKNLNPKLVKALKLFVFAFLIYLIIAPFLPELNYQLRNLLGIQYKEEIVLLEEKEEENDEEEEDLGRRETRFEDFDMTGNRLIIPTIGVHIPIVEGSDESVLNRGAWRRPNTSTPDRGGNTVITGHRFHYIPPNNKTFYNLNKVGIGSKVFVIWNDKEYVYTVYERFIVEPEQTEIEGPMQGNILTLYTCHPLWTANQRLVVRGRLSE